MSLDEESLHSLLTDRIKDLTDTELAKLARIIETRIKEKYRRNAQVEIADVPHALTASRDWPHAPVHRLGEHGTFIVTAGTLYKQHFFRGAERLDLLESRLLSKARQWKWQIEAWSVFSNHYHFVGHSAPGTKALNDFLRDLHADTALALNRLDNALGRQVWHNYWETRLTYERSYLARLNYVHQNAVKHGLVRVANQYRWCSAAWFQRTATLAQVKTIYSFKIDKLRVLDDFDVEV